MEALEFTIRECELHCNEHKLNYGTTKLVRFKTNIRGRQDFWYFGEENALA